MLAPIEKLGRHEVARLLRCYPETVTVFLRNDMLCVACLVGWFHTVRDACDEHDVETDAFCRELWASMEPKSREQLLGI